MTEPPALSSVFVFLGPSLPVDEARRILDAIYLPPVSMGDVYRLMARAPRVIAIIDGLFEQTPAVWHKEILYALSRGVRVLGASSMGALRAAELAAFGMEGVGEVFEAFHRGELEDDDEVAVAHAPAADGYRSLSDAMVNLRAGLREARDTGRISAASHDRLLGAANRNAGWNFGARQKPMPARSMQRSTPSGDSSMATPSSSSTSAAPHCDEAARAPCLQTGTPAPATTMAAIVLTLIEWLRSPPVPTMSTALDRRSSSSGTSVAASSTASSSA